MKAWGFVAARGGSKSIPRKNLLRLAGRPLLDYGVTAAQASGCLERIFVSTDDEEIADRARELGAEMAVRPAELATDAARVDDAAAAFLADFDAEDLPDALVLIQPTSPFVLPGHFHDIVDGLAARPAASSIHNVVALAHNTHAWNHRRLGADGSVEFLFAAERSAARNKQDKPALYVFGNLIAARTERLVTGQGFYAAPAHGVEITMPWAFDLDAPEDLPLAEALLSSGLVKLPHLDSCG